MNRTDAPRGAGSARRSIHQRLQSKSWRKTPPARLRRVNPPKNAARARGAIRGHHTTVAPRLQGGPLLQAFELLAGDVQVLAAGLLGQVFEDFAVAAQAQVDRVNLYGRAAARLV